MAPGFGERGFEGKVATVQYAREQKIPYFGICYGMQAAVIEYARNVLGWSDSSTTEVHPDSTKPVIALMDEQMHITDMGGTMRLGAQKCPWKKDQRLLRPMVKQPFQSVTVTAMNLIMNIKKNWLLRDCIPPELIQIVDWLR